MTLKIHQQFEDWVDASPVDILVILQLAIAMLVLVEGYERPQPPYPENLKSRFLWALGRRKGSPW